MPQSAIDRFPASRRNELMERISRGARRLRGGVGANGVVTLTMQGRGDSCEQLCVQLGVIPIATFPNPTSLTGTFQAWAARRPASTETVTVVGATASTVFTVPDGAKSVAFAAGGAAVALTATDSLDAAAKGRALTTILP